MGTFSRTEEEIKAIIEEWRQAKQEGVLMVDFCESKGIDRTTFSSSWLKKWAPELRPGREPGQAAAPRKPREPKPQAQTQTIDETLEDLETIKINEATKEKATNTKAERIGLYVACDKELKELITISATLTTGGSIKKFIDIVIEEYFENHKDLKQKAKMYKDFFQNLNK